MFRMIFLRFHSNSSKTWPSKVIPFIQPLIMFIWLIVPPEGPLSDAKRTEFAISDMIVIALTTKFWEEYKLFSLVMTKEVLFWNWWQDSISGFSFGGFTAIRLLGCWFSFIIFCSLALSADDSKYAWPIFEAKSSSTARSSTSCMPRSSSTWCSISQLIFNGGSSSSLELCLFLFLNSSPIEESVSFWGVPPTAEPWSASILWEPLTLSFWPGYLFPHYC